MSSRKHGPDDGADRFSDSHRVDRRAQQLCREVQRTLTAALGALDDPCLSGLIVDAVEPAPDSARLLVSVMPAPAEADPAGVLDRLRRLTGRLRAEIAAALQRKRTPELAFRLVLPPTGADEP